MSAWAPKRFWKETSLTEAEGGFTLHLDGRPVKTPAKAPLVVPTRALAEDLAQEWEAQQGLIKPETMPATRAANSAIDKLSLQRAEVIDMLAAYGGTDLLCYRAERPAPLVALQAEAWDPLLAWAAEHFAAPLTVTSGVLPVAQPEASLAALKAGIEALDNFSLAAFHDLVAISGSLVIALAVIHGRLDIDAAWAAARVDETWQIAQWGEDEEEAVLEAARCRAFKQAHRFFTLCR